MASPSVMAFGQTYPELIERLSAGTFDMARSNAPALQARVVCDEAKSCAGFGRLRQVSVGHGGALNRGHNIMQALQIGSF